MLKNQGSSVLMQAFGAMIRGESPQQFMQNLAKTNPQLQGLDLSNLNQTAERLYKENVEDYTAAQSSMRERVNQFIANK